jgi:hypothetical protein
MAAVYLGEGTGAGDEARTRDLLLGKQTLYQLSYSRSDRDGTKPAGRRGKAHC